MKGVKKPCHLITIFKSQYEKNVTSIHVTMDIMNLVIFKLYIIMDIGVIETIKHFEIINIRFSYLILVNNHDHIVFNIIMWNIFYIYIFRVWIYEFMVWFFLVCACGVPICNPYDHYLRKLPSNVYKYFNNLWNYLELCTHNLYNH